MEYILNWMVLLLSLGGIVLVVMVCYLDLVRGGTHIPDPVPPVAEAPVRMQDSAAVAAGPFVEVCYRRGEDVEYVQRVYAGHPGYIGTESYPGLGPGMPVRHVEITWRDGSFYISNLDWQAPVRVRDESGTETEVSVGQVVPLADGAELLLSGGWTITCSVNEGGGE